MHRTNICQCIYFFKKYSKCKSNILSRIRARNGFKHAMHHVAPNGMLQHTEWAKKKQNGPKWTKTMFTESVGFLPKWAFAKMDFFNT